MKIFLERIKKHVPVLMQETPIAAAVLIIIVQTESDTLELITTKRSQQVGRYAGDYCFPGGIKEAIDADYQETAKREVAEELGLSADSYQIIGQLDDFFDRYQNLVRPYVAVMSKETFLQHSRNSIAEIEKIYFFPLEHLSNLYTDKSLELITRRHPAYKYVQDDVLIWGLTASIMVHLENILFDKNRAISKKLASKI